MAIKGKGKSRRRTVTGGPKAMYVEPPKALYRRRWLQVTVAAVLVVGLAIGLMTVFLIKASNDRKDKARALVVQRKDQERTIVLQFSSTVTQAITPVSQAFQDSFVPFPDLTQGFTQLQSGNTVQTSQLVTTANSNGKLALAAYNAINQIPVADEISGHPDLLDLVDAQSFLGQSLKLYQQLAQMMKEAAQATGDTRTALVTQAQGLLPVGATLFQDGIQKINNLRTTLGVPTQPVPPPAPQPPTGLTGPTGATGTPSASPSAKASGHPSPKPKPKGSGSPKPRASSSPTG
ncbi:MAG: hypothetical protein M3Q23_12490 [Actinomycetota bacterium]|nr:hypothetical protein [Actinomycetota bacterium]